MPGNCAAHKDGKSILEAERRAHFDLEFLRVLAFDLFINCARVCDGLMLENR